MVRAIRHWWPFALLAAAIPAGAQQRTTGAPPTRSDSAVVAVGDSVTLRIVDVELRAAIQLLGRYLDRPVLFAAPATGRVTLETPRPVARADVPRLIRGLVGTHGLEFVDDSAAGAWRVQPRSAPVQASPQTQVTRAATSQATVAQLHVIRLRHARAADVAQTVNALYGRSGALGELGARPSTLSRDLRESAIPPQSPYSSGAPSSAVVPNDAGAMPRGATLTGDITIVPDANSNSLLIRANAADFALVDAAVRELDIRPLQVLIEVVIAEIRRDRGLQFGVAGRVPQTQLRGPGDLRMGGEVNGDGPSDLVLRLISRGGRIEYDATLLAAASRGDVAIHSRPVLLAANNESAEIVVGSQRPFVQLQRTLPTDQGARDQIIQYRDVGTRLSVRPTISADGYVMLELTQEVNAATGEVAFAAPVISTRSVQTRLLVRDSQTVAVGGLTDRQRDRAQRGVPILSAIPLLGGLFGRYDRRSSETELFLFITPHVLRDDDDARQITQPLERRIRRP